MKIKISLTLFVGMLSCLPSLLAIERFDIAKCEQNFDLSAQGLCTIHIAYGNIHLINHEFALALADFEKGRIILEQSDQFFPELEFFVSLGKVIAYDNLCLENEARAEIRNLFCVLHSCEIEISETVDSNDSCSDNYSEATESLKELVNLACTIEVRETLLAIINRMSSELMIFTDNYYDSLDYLQDESNLMNKDLSLIKRFKKIARKIYRVCTIIIRVVELLEKLEKAITN